MERRDTTAVTGFVPFPAVTTIYDVDVGGGGLIPGGTYQLRVVAPDGRTVTGRTTIPNAVSSTAAAPTQSIDRNLDTVSLQWARVAARGAIRSSFVRPASTYSLFAADTSVALPGTAQDVSGPSLSACTDREQPTTQCVYVRVRERAHVQLAVIAVDENYFGYYHRTSDFFSATGLVMHLDGGIGVFGSVVIVATRTIVVK